MKVKSIQVLTYAIDDLEIGIKFYDKLEEGVGDYFWDSLLADIESLVIYAGIHSRKHGFYRMLAKRFPYAIYYEIKKETAYIYAILPMRRDPGWLKSKMKERT